MGIILDIIIIAIFMSSIILGYKRGLVKVIFSLCAVIMALILTIVLYKPITNSVIKNTNIDEDLRDTIISKGIIDENGNENTEEEGTINSYIEKYLSDAVTKTANSTIETTAGVLAEKIVSIGVMIVLFIVIRLVLIILRFIISGIAELPIIKQCDKLGGIIYGIISGLIIIYVILAIMFLIVSVNNTGIFANAINTSFISKILYSNNIILNIIFS